MSRIVVLLPRYMANTGEATGELKSMTRRGGQALTSEHEQDLDAQLEDENGYAFEDDPFAACELVRVLDAANQRLSCTLLEGY